LGSRYARDIKFGGRQIMSNANHLDDRINKIFENDAKKNSSFW